MPDSALTHQLLDACQRGRSEAFEHLFARHRKRLRAFVGGRLHPALANRLDASDIVQETQAVMVARLDDFLARRPMPFRTWAIKTAFDCLGKAHRTHILTDKRSVLHEVSLPDASSLDLAQQILATTDSASDRLQREETIKTVRRALTRLSNTDREILLMRNLDGLSNGEIGDILNLSAEAVSKRHGRALVRLHACLNELDKDLD